MRYSSRNHRPNASGQTAYEGAARGHTGQVLADLHDEAGQFVRVAVVADCRDPHSAKRFADYHNSQPITGE